MFYYQVLQYLVGKDKKYLNGDKNNRNYESLHDFLCIRFVLQELVAEKHYMHFNRQYKRQLVLIRSITIY